MCYVQIDGHFDRVTSSAVEKDLVERKEIQGRIRSQP